MPQAPERGHGAGLCSKPGLRHNAVRMEASSTTRAAVNPRAPACSYALAVLAAAACGVLRLALDPVFGDTAGLILFTPALMVAAAFGGFGPAVAATTIAVVVAA